MIAFGPTEEQELMRDTVCEFAMSELREAGRACDEASEASADVVARAQELGLIAGPIPEQHGGGGIERSPVTSAILLEELACGDAPLAATLMASSLFVQPLLDFGTPEQQAEYLPLFTTGEPHAATLALHEPSFGFDAARLQTIAEPKGDGYRVTGVKRFVPLGASASHFLVVARGASEGLSGLEAFIVPRDAKGLLVADEPEKTLGFQALSRSALELDGVELPASARLGGDAGIDGARLLNLCRMGSAALALGLSRAVMEFAIPYAKERVAFGQPIAQKQAIAFKLAEMQIEVSSMRHLVWKAASLLEHGLDATRASTLAQTYTNRETMKIADNGLQTFGGHGFIREYPVEMWYRNARALTVSEGVVCL